MPFSRLLKKAVVESEKNYEEIVKECREKGKKVDKPQLSRLLNGKVKSMPNEELVRVLAQICNYDERQLVLENYIDYAPKEIFEVLVSIKELVMLITLNIFKKDISEEQINELNKVVREEPLADFIIQMLENKDVIISSIENEFNINLKDDEFNLKLKEPISIIVNDKGMEPFIKEGAKVSFELKENYDINDILIIKIKKTEEIKIRQVLNYKNKVQLIPLNKNYKKEEYKIADIIILGRVNKIITEL